jgi:hypothetical protein
LTELINNYPPILGADKDIFIQHFGKNYKMESDVYTYENFTFSFHPNRKGKVYEVDLSNDVDERSNFKEGLYKEEATNIVKKFLPQDTTLIRKVTFGKSRHSSDENEKNLYLLYKSDSIKTISEGLRLMDVGQTKEGKIQAIISYNDKKVKHITVTVNDWNNDFR